MKPLELNRQYFTRLCIYPADENTNLSEKIFNFLFCAILISIAMICFLSSVSYFYKNSKINMENAIYALFQVGALSTVLYTLLVGLRSRQKIFEVFAELQEIYDSSKTNYCESN